MSSRGRLSVIFTAIVLLFASILFIAYMLFYNENIFLSIEPNKGKSKIENATSYPVKPSIADSHENSSFLPKYKDIIERQDRKPIVGSAEIIGNVIYASNKQPVKDADINIYSTRYSCELVMRRLIVCTEALDNRPDLFPLLEELKLIHDYLQGKSPSIDANLKKKMIKDFIRPKDPIESLKTGQDGKFTFVSDAPCVLIVFVCADLFGNPRDTTQVINVPSDLKQIYITFIVQDEYLDLSGRIINSKGDGIENANVLAVEDKLKTVKGRPGFDKWETASDEFGYFSIDRMTVDGDIFLRITKEGYIPLVVKVEIATGVTIYREFTLKKGPEIAGTVKDQFNRHVIDVKIVAVARTETEKGSWTEEFHSETDGHGRFKIGLMTELTNIELLFYKNGFCAVRKTIDGKKDKNIEICIEKGGGLLIEGVVQDEDGMKIRTNVEIAIHGITSPIASIETDDKGRFMYEGLEDAKYILSIDAGEEYDPFIKEFLPPETDMVIILKKADWEKQ